MINFKNSPSCLILISDIFMAYLTPCANPYTQLKMTYKQSDLSMKNNLFVVMMYALQSCVTVCAKKAFFSVLHLNRVSL